MKAVAAFAMLVGAAAHGFHQQPLRSSSVAAIIPPGTLSHFCVITSWDGYNETLATYGTLFGVQPPVPGIAGGPSSNGTYMGKQLLGTTKIAFMDLNNMTRMEFLAGEPSQPSWWRDVYLQKGYSVHHMGYVLPDGTAIWPVVQAFAAAFGPAVQWGRWGTIDTPGSGCYVYMDSIATLGVTTEILANESDCDDLPAPPSA